MWAHPPKVESPDVERATDKEPIADAHGLVNDVLHETGIEASLQGNVIGNWQVGLQCFISQITYDVLLLIISFLVNKYFDKKV